MTSRIDSELITLAVAGDEEAFTELVRRYRDAVYGYCYYRSGNFEDARDLSQETFILAYRKLGQLRESEKLGAWLRRIAANLCTRWSENQREMPVEEVTQQTQQESPRAALVREALSNLPDNERLAVVMHYVDGLSYGEIAGFLETSATTVKGRLYRGREMLKKEVLKMTQEAFGENKLDEEFVVKAALKAIHDCGKAYDVDRNPSLARKKAEEAVEILDRIDSKSRDVIIARMDALWWKAATSPTVEEHNAWIDRMHDVGLESDDPRIVAERLASLAGGCYLKCKWQEGDEFLEKARAIMRNIDAPDLLNFDGTEAIGARDRGDFERAKQLFQRIVDYRQTNYHHEKPWEIRGDQYYEAAVRSLESLPSDVKHEDVGFLDHTSGYFTVHDDRIDLSSGGGGCRWREGWDDDLPYFWNSLPMFE